ncbi:MAG: 4Fe-4S binding protein [Candidatus Omnitrophota bacterium]
MLILSYFKGRFWCWNLCPRGAFLDLALSKFSRKNKFPKIFSSIKFRWAFFALFMSFFIFQLIIAPKNIYAIGFVFVRMCLLTTLIAILLGIPLLERAWCIICPMGTLQHKISQLNKRK